MCEREREREEGGGGGGGGEGAWVVKRIDRYAHTSVHTVCYSMPTSRSREN